MLSPMGTYASLETPLDKFTVAVDSNGVVTAAVFGDESVLRTRCPKDIFVRNAKAASKVLAQVDEWFAGKRREFSVPLLPAGTPFQQRVWRAVSQIPYGETRSYAYIAKAVKSSTRAVGRAVATNPVCLLIPCHRVIGINGAITGYAFGKDRKRYLLDFERKHRRNYG